jgi:shikimate kinase
VSSELSLHESPSPTSLPGAHLYLCGYRGTGKTSVAAVLSQRLQMSWVDMDVEIEAHAGKTIREIFAEGGEPRFRDLESEVLEKWSTAKPHIIALGGGAILRPANRATIARTGRCVWLTATPETILSRTQSDTTSGQRRPALTDRDPLDEIRTLLAARESSYRAAANAQFSTDSLDLDQIAVQIVRWWNDEGRSPKMGVSSHGSDR